MDRFGGLDIRLSGIGCGEMGNEVRNIFIAGRASMHFVAKPGQIALVSIMRLMIIRGADGLTRRRETIFVPPSDLPRLPAKLLDPGASKSFHRCKMMQMSGGAGRSRER